MKLNREAHDQQGHAMVKEEATEPKGKRHKSFIHQCFGHDQGAINEGFKDCEDRLKQALAREMAERNAATEFEGAVKTKKIVDVQQDDDGVMGTNLKRKSILIAKRLIMRMRITLANPSSVKWTLRFVSEPRRSIGS